MKIAIYARVSSVAQDVDLSISAQLKSLREYASKNGHSIVREFIDEAESGCTDSRPEFREMINLAHSKEKPFDAILVWKFSRFARSRRDSIVYKTLLRKDHVQVVSINEPSEDTPTGRLLEGIIESLDEFYSDNLGPGSLPRHEGKRFAGFLHCAQAALRLRQGQSERRRTRKNEAGS